MLNVTMAARLRLSQKLTGKKAAQHQVLRFTRREGGWTLQPDHTSPDDAAFMHDGRVVLVLDRGVSEAMKDMTLDVEDTEAGPRLTLH